MHSDKCPFIGHSYIFEYEGFSARDTFISETEMQFEVLSGPVKGAKGRATYQVKQVSDTLYLLTWQEDDGGTVIHLDDFAHGISRSHYTDPQLNFYVMEGRITPVESR